MNQINNLHLSIHVATMTVKAFYYYYSIQTIGVRLEFTPDEQSGMVRRESNISMEGL